jgi:hypothetical protein
MFSNCPSMETCERQTECTSESNTQELFDKYMINLLIRLD